MKTSIRILFGLLLMAAGTLSQAQNNANDLIKRTVKTIRDPKNVEMIFTYHFSSDASSPLIEKHEGTACLQGEAYKIVMDEQETISDGKTIWTYLKDDEEVMVSDAAEGNDNTPLKLLTTLDKDYTAKYMGKDKEGLTIIELSTQKGLYKKVTVKIDEKKGKLKEATIHADDGSTLNILITEWKRNQDLKDGFFSFDEKAHPEAEIIDMR